MRLKKSVCLVTWAFHIAGDHQQPKAANSSTSVAKKANVRLVSKNSISPITGYFCN